MSNSQYSDGYTHEALHTTYVLMETFGAHVVETRCAEHFPDVKAAADKAYQAMFDLYELIGSKLEDDLAPLDPADDVPKADE